MCHDAAVLAGNVRRLTPVDILRLANKRLEALADNTSWINASGRTSRATTRGRIRDIERSAISLIAINRSWESEIRRQSYVRRLARVHPTFVRATGVDCAARIIRDVDASSLVARGIRFHDIPVEQWEDFRPGSIALVIGAVGVGDRAIPVTDADWYLVQAAFVGVANSILVIVNVSAGVNTLEPGEHRHVAHINIGVVHRCRFVLDNLIEPLVPHHDLVAASRQPREGKVAIAVASRDGYVLSNAILCVSSHIAGGLR